MDQLKVITDSTEEIEKSNEIINNIFKAIGNINIPESMKEFPKVNNEIPYKHFGIKMGDKVQSEKYCVEIMERSEEYLRVITKKDLNDIILIRTINTDTISILKYGYEIIDWKICKIEQIDKNIRKVLSEAKVYGAKMGSERLFVKMEDIQWESKKSNGTMARILNHHICDKDTYANMWRQLNIKKDACLQIVKMQQKDTMIGSKKAAIQKNKQYKYFKKEIATIPHAILKCGSTKKATHPKP
ncbi:uncharacterized protein QTN25_003582 [Entamoeba marina]